MQFPFQFQLQFIERELATMRQLATPSDVSKVFLTSTHPQRERGEERERGEREGGERGKSAAREATKTLGNFDGNL